MKTSSHILTAMLFCCSFFCNSNLQAQFSLNITYYENVDVEPNMYGFHMSNFFEQCVCYDPLYTGPFTVDSINQCMSFAAALKPVVIRYPAGGEDKFMHPEDPNGYGMRYADIDSFLERGWLKVEDAVDKYADIDNQNTNFTGIRFLDRLVDFVEYCGEVNGFKPDVIFVSNILLGLLENYDVTTENLSAIRYLLNHDIHISGIEIGNEHYDDTDTMKNPIFTNFDTYWNLVKPLLDSLDADPQLDSIPVGLVSTPEPGHAASKGKSPAGVNRFKQWNQSLKLHAQNAIDKLLFDAYIVHLYVEPDDMPQCYRQYYDDYFNNDGTAILDPDNRLIPAWECAQDSFKIFAETEVRNIFNAYGNTCTGCLGTDKPYWLTEWGIFGVEGNYEVNNLILDTIAGSFANTFVDAAYAFQFLLSMSDYEMKLGGISKANIGFMIKHNYMSRSLGGAVNYRIKNDPEGPTDPWYIRRANYWPFYMTRDIFVRNYERVKSSVTLLDGETRTPFIQTFYYPNPYAYVIPPARCTETGGGTVNPMFYMYFYNPYPESIVFKHEEMQGFNSELGTTFEPSSDVAAFMKYINPAQLYYHAGTTQYLVDNDFYTGSNEDVTPLIAGIESDNVFFCDEEEIVLPPYSLGYVYWEISPVPYKITESEHDTVKAYPNPASEYISFTLQNTENTEGDYSLLVFDIMGKTIFESKFTQQGVTFYKQSLPAGMYLYHVVHNSTITDAGKFVFAE